ncbi:methyltransferase family protein [Thalassiella azotivora]
MTLLALGLFVLYLVLAFVLRTLVQLRWTGDSGFRGISGRPGSARWWAGVLFAAALAAGLAGPVAGLLGLAPLAVLDRPWIAAAGTLTAVLGVAATVRTQLAMGTSWRIGVDPTETTTLVTTGPFALVRNPIFAAMAITGTGLSLMVPNAIAVTGAALLLIALQLQVRVVEEPYLRRVHGWAYHAYAARTGRFVPALGRLRAPQPDPLPGG